jgi:hypothetical protein
MAQHPEELARKEFGTRRLLGLETACSHGLCWNLGHKMFVGTTPEDHTAANYV